MLMKVLKWTAIAVGALIGLAVVLALSLQVMSISRERRQYAIAPEKLVLHATPDRTRGEHLAQIGCVGCHGVDLGGQEMVNNALMGTIWSRNLTRGDGGIGASFKTADFVRAIRFGVHEDGRSVLIMPTNAFEHFSDSDLASIIAYVDSVPRVDRTTPGPRIGPLARVLSVLTPFPLYSAEHVEANATHTMPPPDDTLAYGTYLAAVGGCTECHGSTLANGGNGPNITMGGPLRSWTEADFVRAIREGKRPDSTAISEAMPWKDFRKMTDAELHALWIYINSMPSLASKPK